MPLKPWTEKQLTYLTKHYKDFDNAVLAEVLGKSVEAMRTRATLLGLKKTRRQENYKNWTAADDDLIRNEYPLGDLPQLAAHLGVKKSVLQQRANLIGVKRDPDLVRETARKMGKALAEKDMGKRFEIGHVSHNKGKKLEEFISAQGIEKVRATQFKKGNLPHNYKPVGHERVDKDGYVEVKVRDADDSKQNFEFKHRLLYVAHNGPIPEGCIVEFADGNKQNFDPSNLVVRTREQNLRANADSPSSVVKRFMRIKDPDMVKEIIETRPDLVELARIKAKVNGKLDQIKRGARKS